MLKKLILFLFLALANTIFAQDEIVEIEDSPQNFFIEAQTALKNQDLRYAHTLFSLSKKSSSDEKIRNESLKKIDSLKVILRENLITKIRGNWKMLNNESWAMRDLSDSIVGKMITIESNEILFYELYPKAKKWNLVSTEQLLFSEKENMDFDPLYITYSNKEIWSYYVDEISGNLIAYYVGQEFETGISELVCGNPQIKYFKLR